MNFIKNKNSLKDKFKYTEDGRKIRLDTKKSKKEFIKLLNDNFLHSELTGEDYDVIAKDNLQVHKE